MRLNDLVFSMKGFFCITFTSSLALVELFIGSIFWQHVFSELESFMFFICKIADIVENISV